MIISNKMEISKRRKKEEKMKRRSKKLISLLVATGLLAGSLAGCGNSDKGSDPSSGSEAGTETGAEAGAENLSIVVSHQPYSHGLPSYIGEQEGTFSDAGLDMEILWFSGGNTQNEEIGRAHV